jgi:predicted nuclease of predicted toxin-antitoxin system
MLLMNLFADECCDVLLVRELRAGGHDVVYAKEDFPGQPDEVVLKAAFDQDRILLTEDKDFGELVYRLAFPARGIILLRPMPR